jgi:hypothetical protein
MWALEMTAPSESRTVPESVAAFAETAASSKITEKLRDFMTPIIGRPPKVRKAAFAEGLSSNPIAGGKRISQQLSIHGIPRVTSAP